MEAHEVQEEAVVEGAQGSLPFRAVVVVVAEVVVEFHHSLQHQDHLIHPRSCLDPKNLDPSLEVDSWLLSSHGPSRSDQLPSASVALVSAPLPECQKKTKQEKLTKF